MVINFGLYYAVSVSLASSTIKLMVLMVNLRIIIYD